MFLLLNLVSLFLCVPSVFFCFLFFFQILCIRKISLPFILYGLLHRQEDLHQSVWLEILLKPFGDGGSRRAWWRRDVTCLRLRNLRVGQVCNFFSGAPDRLGSLVFACRAVLQFFYAAAGSHPSLFSLAPRHPKYIFFPLAPQIRQDIPVPGATLQKAETPNTHCVLSSSQGGSRELGTFS